MAAEEPLTLGNGPQDRAESHSHCGLAEPPLGQWLQGGEQLLSLLPSPQLPPLGSSPLCQHRR